MSSKYFLKDKKCMVYKATNVQDPSGYYTTYYRPIAQSDLWCYAKQLSEDMKLRAGAYGAQETRMWVINYHSGVVPGDLIKYRNQWYEITRVDTENDYNTDMFLYGKDEHTPSDVRPYSPTTTT